MKSKLTLTAVLAALAMAIPAGQCLNYRDYQEFRQVATTCEHQGKWQQIHWLKDMEQAKAQARAQNKPILVFLVIGFHGEANASDC